MRPPSYEGRDHVTTTTLSVATVTLMFVGAEGGASNSKTEGGHIRIKMTVSYYYYYHYYYYYYLFIYFRLLD